MAAKRRLIVYALHYDLSPHVYVGKSCWGMSRPRSHGLACNIAKNARFPVSRWIKKIRDKGTDYNISILEDLVESEELLVEAERFYISYFRSLGIPLLNLTNGGEGVSGYRHTDDARQKMSLSKKGKPAAAGTIAAASMRWHGADNPKFGKTLSAEQRAFLSALRKGKKLSEETRQKMSRSRTKPRIAPDPVAIAIRAQEVSDARSEVLIKRNSDPAYQAKCLAGRTEESKQRAKQTRQKTLVANPLLRAQEIERLRSPENIEKAKAALQAYLSSETAEARAQRRQRSIDVLSRPDVKAKALAACRTEEAKKKRSEATRKAMAAPEVKQKLADRWADPAFKEKHRQAVCNALRNRHAT